MEPMDEPPSTSAVMESASQLLEQRREIRRAISLQLEEFRRREELLKQQTSSLIEQDEDKEAEIEDTLWRHASAMSKAWCGPFATHLLKRLPRELRDLVYESLIMPNGKAPELSVYPQDSYNSILENGKTGLAPLMWYGKLPCHEVSDFGEPDPTPFYMKPEFVGSEMPTEIAEFLYAKARFLTYEPDCVQLLLKCDMFNTNASPGMIRNICLSVIVRRTVGQALGSILFVPDLDTFVPYLEQMPALKKVWIELSVELRNNEPGSLKKSDANDADQLLRPKLFELKKRGIAIVVLRRNSHRGASTYDIMVNKPLEEWDNYQDLVGQAEETMTVSG